MDNHSQLIRRHKFHKLQYKRACNTALIAPFSSPNRPFHREIWEKGRTYPIVMQNALCIPALKHMTRFADAKSR